MLEDRLVLELDRWSRKDTFFFPPHRTTGKILKSKTLIKTFWLQVAENNSNYL